MSALDDWPTIQCKPAPTDDEIEFWNDLAYIKALAEAIIDIRIEDRLMRR
jgi:hypothetical protein